MGFEACLGGLGDLVGPLGLGLGQMLVSDVWNGPVARRLCSVLCWGGGRCGFIWTCLSDVWESLLEGKWEMNAGSLRMYRDFNSLSRRAV